MKTYTCKYCKIGNFTRGQIGRHIQLEHTEGIPTVTRKRLVRESSYNLNPKLCLYCKKSITYQNSIKRNRFCTSSCAALYNNALRSVKRKSKLYVCTNCQTSSRNRKFCSSKCCGNYRKKQRIKKWLETGKFCNSLFVSAGSTIREYILSEQNNKCTICNREPVWEGKILSFILDHIDGNALDSRRHNLRMICPNCESQTSTYKSRNNGKGRGSLQKQLNKQGV